MTRWRKAVYRVPKTAENWKAYARTSADNTGLWHAMRMLASWRHQRNELPEGYELADLLHDDVM